MKLFKSTSSHLVPLCFHNFTLWPLVSLLLHIVVNCAFLMKLLELFLLPLLHRFTCPSLSLMFFSVAFFWMKLFKSTLSPPGSTLFPQLQTLPNLFLFYFTLLWRVIFDRTPQIVSFPSLLSLHSPIAFSYVFRVVFFWIRLFKSIPSHLHCVSTASHFAYLFLFSFPLWWIVSFLVKLLELFLLLHLHRFTCPSLSLIFLVWSSYGWNSPNPFLVKDFS